MDKTAAMKILNPGAMLTALDFLYPTFNIHLNFKLMDPKIVKILKVVEQF